MRILGKLMTLSMALSVLACNSQSSSNPSPGKNAIYAKLSELRALNTQELALASEVCQALEYKRVSFPLDYIGSTFVYKLSSESCSGTSTSGEETQALAVTGTPQQEQLSLGQYSLNTDLHGLLASFCRKLNDTGRAENSEENGHYQLKQYSFQSKGVRLARVEIISAQRRVLKGPYDIIIGHDILEIDLSDSLSRGLENFHQQEKKCADGLTRKVSTETRRLVRINK